MRRTGMAGSYVAAAILAIAAALNIVVGLTALDEEFNFTFLFSLVGLGISAVGGVVLWLALRPPRTFVLSHDKDESDVIPSYDDATADRTPKDVR